MSTSTIRPVSVASSIIEDAIEAWRDVDRITWRACELSYLCHEAGYTYAEIGAFVGRDGDTIGTYSAAWELRQRLTASIDEEVIDYLSAKLSVSHFRHAAGWERAVLRWLDGASKNELELARVEGVHTPAAREQKIYSWLNDCINREDDTIMSSRAFQRELSAHLAILAGRDEGKALFDTLFSFLPKLNIFSTVRIDGMDMSEARRGILREMAATAKRLVVLMEQWRGA